MRRNLPYANFDLQEISDLLKDSNGRRNLLCGNFDLETL